MLIGEAPGREEDLTGRPFVGRAGRLLDEVLSELGMSREDVFITSVVKCRPPSNRNPKKSEIGACLEYTLRQMEALKPKVVVLLGNVALEALTGRKGIGKLRGRFIEERGFKFLPTYHPAAVVRNKNLLPMLKEDLQKIIHIKN